MLKYLYRDITFREVPNKVSLTLSISNCQNLCLGCHSPELRTDTGATLSTTEVDKLMKAYALHIDVLCLLGHGHKKDEGELIVLLEYMKHTYPSVEVCLYSGCVNTNKDLIPYLAYYKVGPYVEHMGGLDKKTTNQKFYKIIKGELEDQTYLFLN